MGNNEAKLCYKQASYFSATTTTTNTQEFTLSPRIPSLLNWEMECFGANHCIRNKWIKKSRYAGFVLRSKMPSPFSSSFSVVSQLCLSLYIVCLLLKKCTISHTIHTHTHTSRKQTIYPFVFTQSNNGRGRALTRVTNILNKSLFVLCGCFLHTNPTFTHLH